VRFSICAKLGIAAALCGLLSLALPGRAADGSRIELTARKFEFGTKEIRVKKGQPVTLVLRAEDFAHGFSVPDFKVRADFVPGKNVEVTFTPDRAGSFDFLCDNFCGDGHDDMNGTLIVTES
jgi:cytochrome c oxidase subunit 2